MNTSINDSEDVVELSTKPVNSEFLCFVVDRSRVLAFDDIVKICTDFFSDDEILLARQVIDNLGIRLPKRQGVNKIRSTVEDIVKVVLNPNTSLPEFYAVNLNRLPPISVTHCDVAGILCELQALRAEIRGISQLKEEVLELKKEMALLKQGREDMCSGRYGVTPTAAIPSSATKLLCVTDTVVPTKSFANYAQDVATADPPEFKRAVKKKSKLIIGAANGNSSLKSVQTMRTIDVFVSRLHPDTANNELIDCIQESKGDICVSDVKCTRLQAKYAHLYSSFHVALMVSSTDLYRAVDVFMSPEAWPSGVFVKRYFKKKDGSDQ